MLFQFCQNQIQDTVQTVRFKDIRGKARTVNQQVRYWLRARLVISVSPGHGWRLVDRVVSSCFSAWETFCAAAPLPGWQFGLAEVLLEPCECHCCERCARFECPQISVPTPASKPLVTCPLFSRPRLLASSFLSDFFLPASLAFCLLAACCSWCPGPLGCPTEPRRRLRRDVRASSGHISQSSRFSRGESRVPLRRSGAWRSCVTSGVLFVVCLPQ